MDKAPVPAWMEKLRHEYALVDAQRDAARKREVENSARLQQEGPKFWSQIQKSLETVVDSLPVLKLSGGISRFSEGIRVEVVYQHLVPVQTYTDISYNPGSAVLRCTTMSGGIFQLYLCVADSDEIAAVSELGGKPMDPEQAAEFIMRPMVDCVVIRN